MSAPRLHRKGGKAVAPQSKALSNLSQDWSAKAEACGAAPVHIVNEATVPDGPETIIPPGFDYQEIFYVLDNDVVKPKETESSPCQCPDGNCNANNCSCVRTSRALNALGKIMPVYTSDGLFVLDLQLTSEIKECNSNCACTGAACKNRVSQKPRDFDLTIAKTNDGWRVRTNSELPKGKVLGVYTGLVIRRSKHVMDADNIWVWDLDGLRNLDAFASSDNTPIEEYSVYCKSTGNWSRFLRNSETPNLKTYAVLHDVPAGSGMPFLAFVAKENIPANSELTVNYYASDERFVQPTASNKVERPISKTRKRTRRAKGKRAERGESVEC